MKRGPAWALGGLLALGAVAVGIRLTTGPEAPPSRPVPPVAPVVASPLPPAAPVDPLDRRLPPPAYNAPESAWGGYRQALGELRGGPDPALAALAADRIRRLDDRVEFQKYLAERHAAALEEHKRALGEQRALSEAKDREARQRFLDAGFNPDGPPPAPLFKRPELGPPLKKP